MWHRRVECAACFANPKWCPDVEIVFGGLQLFSRFESHLSAISFQDMYKSLFILGYE
jgi:hypothetical protein